MHAISIAAIVSGLIAAAPISAAADQTITESFSLTVPASVVPNFASDFARISSTPFPFFAPTTGTLDSVSGTITGSLSWASIAENPELAVEFEAVTSTALTLHNVSFFFTTGTLDLNVSVVETNAEVLSGFVGAGNTDATLAYDTANPTNTGVIESNGPLTGSITYTYTLPTLTLAVPEPSTWAMMLLGFVGLGYAGYRRARAA
jgi:hypothetical protein